MTFRPYACRTRWEGIAVSSWVLLIDLLLLVWLIRRPVDWLKFVLLLLVIGSLPLLLHLVYRTWAAFTLEYWIDRNAVTVRWANMRQVIPLHSVQRVIQGGVTSIRQGGTWTEWPAPYIGQGRALGLLNITMLATRPLEECLLLDMGNAIFALSPQEQEGFIVALQERYRLGPVRTMAVSRVRSSVIRGYFEEDHIGLTLLVAGLAGALLLFGVLMTQYPDLPDALAFHYNSDGVPDSVREKTALFLLPAIGLIAWLINGAWGIWMVFRKERTGAYMLWGGALIVQVFSLLALTSLTN